MFIVKNKLSRQNSISKKSTNIVADRLASNSGCPFLNTMYQALHFTLFNFILFLSHLQYDHPLWKNYFRTKQPMLFKGSHREHNNKPILAERTRR